MPRPSSSTAGFSFGDLISQIEAADSKWNGTSLSLCPKFLFLLGSKVVPCNRNRVPFLSVVEPYQHSQITCQEHLCGHDNSLPHLLAIICAQGSLGH